MEYHFIHMAAAAGFAVPHLIVTISLHLFECMGLYGGLRMLNCLWFVGITLFINGVPQKKFKQGQIADAWRPIYMTISVNLSTVNVFTQIFNCCMRSVASYIILLKPNIVHNNTVKSGYKKLVVILTSWSLFSKEYGQMMPPLYKPYQTVTRNRCIGFCKTTYGFSKLQIWKFCLLKYLSSWK